MVCYTMTKLDYSRCALLCLFLFFLPIEEAPANVSGGLYLIIATVSLLVNHGLRATYPNRCPRDLAHSSVWFVIMAVVAAMAGINSSFIDWGNSEWFREWISWSAIPLVPLMIVLTASSAREFDWPIKALVLGGLVALVDGWFVWVNTDGMEYPQLRSLGHVNQSAMYLVGLIPIAMHLLISRQHVFWAYSSAALLLLILITMEPMSSVIASSVIVGLGVLYAAQWVRSRGVRNADYFKPGIMMFVGVCIVLSGLIFFVSESRLIGELVLRLTGDDVSSKRLELLNTALLAFRQAPLLGTGLSTFGAATEPEVLRSILMIDWNEWNASAHAYFHSNHGHSIVSTVLVERGIFGLLSVYGFLIWASAFNLLNYVKAKHPNEQWGWMLAGSVLVIIWVGGIGNTLLHNEHGQLMLVGWLLLSRFAYDNINSNDS